MIQKETGRRPQQQVAPPSFPPPSCPRCSSDNTKFCYYNNYTVSQPRYLCKDCRRYWTHGGALRNIPTGGTSRKRGRIDTSSSSSQVSNPPASGGFDYPSINGRVAFRPPIAETMQSFNGGGCFNQTLPFRFSPRGELLGGVNASFGAVNVGFGGMNHLSPLDGFRDFGFSALQPPQNHPLPPSVWTRGQNMAVSSNINYSSTTLSIPNNFLAIARDPAAAANVVGMNEWSELNDVDYEDDALQSYKPPSLP